jgi:methyl-accepting chemotaxis protein
MMNLDVKAQIAERIAGAVCLLAVAGSAAFFAWDSHQTQVITRQAVAGVKNTLVNVNRPCKGPAGPDACGTLAEINKATIQVGDILKTSQMQEKDTARAAQQTMTAVDQMAAHADALTDSLSGTANAATGALTQAQTDLRTLDGTIAAAQPLLAAYTASGYDLDALLKDKSIHRTIDNVDRLSLALAGSTENVQGMTGDAKRVTDDLTKKYFTPRPRWQKVGSTIFDGTKVGVSLGCLVFRAC